jgi:hypothetical protein
MIHKSGLDYDLHTSWTSHMLHPQEAGDTAAQWIFLIDLLNFSFWSDYKEEEQFGVIYRGTKHTGYWALCALIRRALDAGTPILSPELWVAATTEQLEHVFRSDTVEPIPMLKERIANLRQAGSVLLADFDGSFVNCIKKAENSAAALVTLVIDKFPSFCDEAVFKGEKVAFYKRAQILIADLWSCFDGKGLGFFTDIEQITMFADYRVPQGLAYFGILVYSPELQQILASGQPLSPANEAEIRGCSIWAVEYLRQKTALNAIQIDFFLWDYCKDHDSEMQHIPIHRTRTIYY